MTAINWLPFWIAVGVCSMVVLWVVEVDRHVLRFFGRMLCRLGFHAGQTYCSFPEGDEADRQLRRNGRVSTFEWCPRCRPDLAASFGVESIAKPLQP